MRLLAMTVTTLFVFVLSLVALAFLLEPGTEQANARTNNAGTGGGNAAFVLPAYLAGQSSTQGNTLIVNTADDWPEAAPPLEVTEEDPCLDGKDETICTLRHAIHVANIDNVKSTIRFSEHQVIQLTYELPPIRDGQTSLIAEEGQVVELRGDRQLGRILVVEASDTTIRGLTLWGAATAQPVLYVGGQANNVVIARNTIGDNDVIPGYCDGRSENSVGILIDGAGKNPDGVRAWIVGNVIECNGSDGIRLLGGRVRIGQDRTGSGGSNTQNIIMHNNGYAINLGATSGNIIRNCRTGQNSAGSIQYANHNNELANNAFHEDGLPSP